MPQNSAEARKMSEFFTTAGVILLLTHIGYACCSALTRPQGIAGDLGDRFYLIGSRLFFIADETKSKIAVLVLMVPTLAAVRPTDRPIKLKWPLIFLLTGLALFFGTGVLLPINSDRQAAFTYAIITGAGYLVLDAGVSRIFRALRYAFDHKKFGVKNSGFKQVEKRIGTENSLNFETRYQYNGKQRKGYVNIINPRRGLLIMGTPGSGKTLFIIEPAIEQLIRQKRALFVYDFKFPKLTHHTYAKWLEFSSLYPASARFYCINFTDLSHSNRCNLIDPATLRYNSDALGISQTIFLAMNKSWVRKQGEFFQESSITFVGVLIWYLRGYKGGIYCTLPHVIELSKTPYEQLFTVLYAEPSTRGMVMPFVQAFLNNTMEMLDGQISSARIPLIRLDSPDIYYVLSGQESFLDINDPYAPAILCLGGDPARLEALAPVLSLYIDRLNKRINLPNKYPAALVLDEFGTVRATSVLTTVATGRSNNITPILSIQDLSQLKLQYSHDEAEQIMSTTGNLICGQVTGDTARQVSERFHQGSYLKTTISINSTDISTSKTEQPTDEISPAALAQLSSGEFVGIVADDPGTELEIKAFRASFLRKNEQLPLGPLPVVADVTDESLAENYARIGKEVTRLVEEEIKRISSDPELKKFIVKR